MSRSLNRDQIIARAVKLINPPASRLAECRQDVAATLDEYDLGLREYRWEKLPQSKEKRKRIEAVRRAAHRLLIAINNMPDEARSVLPTESIAVLQKIRDELIIRRLNNGPSSRGGVRRDNYDKESAALEAFYLLKEYRGKIATTKKSLWCMLSATLYGRPDADFHYACRECLRFLRQIFKEEEEQAGAHQRVK